MKIRIVSPAKAIDQSKLDFAEGWLSSLGFQVEISPNAGGQLNYFSGTDEERLNDLQDALDDPELDVILCSRGGYGTVRIIDQLDFTKFSQKPKKLIGYSDITVLHNRLTKLGLESIHATAPLNFEENTTEALDSLVAAISNKPIRHEVIPYSLNRKGTATAKVVGGNLAIIASLIGTNDDLNIEGKILFIEDVGEAVYAIDRMMWSLKKSGKLDHLAGLIVGGMTNMKDSEIPFGKTVHEVIDDIVKEYNYPVCYNFPAGHIDDNRAIILNRMADLVVGDKEVIFSQL
ncbi:MAG: LD-carboxypeptidase [Crocinitomicaceae bacterium]